MVLGFSGQSHTCLIENVCVMSIVNVNATFKYKSTSYSENRKTRLSLFHFQIRI